MANTLVTNNFYISTPSACIVDLTPPTFAGLASLSVQSRGQIRATWAAASDATSPIRYEVYIQASTATGLFNVNNIIAVTPHLQYDTFTMPDGSFLVNGTTYYIGVRAIDGVSNRDSNTVSSSVISTGVSVSAEVYLVDGGFVVNANNQLQGTMYALKNSTLATSSNAVMGTASYQVYDKLGVAVPGMGASGIVADVNGQYKITPVNSTLSESLEHYMIQVNINVDGAVRTNYVPLIEKLPEYDISGIFFTNTSSQFDGSFWISANETIKTTGLGSASYQVIDNAGNPVVGMSESSIAADVNGIFKITAISNLLPEAVGYSVKVSITVDSVVRSEIIAIQGKVPAYTTHAQFSINASNQLSATLWACEDGVVKVGSGLGTANYTVYDAAGVAVAGLTQSGITADVNGRFIITPVSAALLTDLTHYSVKVGIQVNGVERISFKGFTLLGT